MCFPPTSFSNIFMSEKEQKEAPYASNLYEMTLKYSNDLRTLFRSWGLTVKIN